MRDRGSMLLLVAMIGLGLTAAITFAMVPVLHDLTDRQAARSAADAAALAGVRGGRAVAANYATRNGAELVGWQRVGDDVIVEVRVGSQTVSARATDAP